MTKNLVFKTNYRLMQVKRISYHLPLTSSFCLFLSGRLTQVLLFLERKGHSQKDQKLVFKTNYHIMQVKSIAECSKGSILQYFRPSLIYHLSLRSPFCLFLSGRLTQVLLFLQRKQRLFSNQ